MSQAAPSLADGNTAAEWVERSGALMAWAVTAAERKATYIGNLRRDQTGLACDCVCPACGGQLQAVNAGKSVHELPPGKSLRPHFRHHTGQQQDMCLVRMSQIVALQLLMKEQVIHLPEQTARYVVGGASGQIYTGEAHRQAFSANVLTGEWIDEHEAKITLEDGRVVWLRLFGAYSKGLDSAGDAIITIKVDDPEVSTWPPEKILEHAQLTGKWMCWERHFDADELAKQAQEDAEREAAHWCDLIPADMDLPANLSHAQRSEGVLHWLIKGILEKAQYIATPSYSDTVTRYMPDQSIESRRVYLEEKTYKISNVRLETRLAGVIPDVMCTAQAKGEEAFELMIEVAVTHKVDQHKTGKLRALGLACIEIDTQKLGKSGRTTVDELQYMVLTHTVNKRWIFHPAIDLRRSQAEKYLKELDDEMGRKLQKERARTAWIRTLNDQDLLHQYLNLLRQTWAGRSPMDARGSPCLPNDLVAELESRRFPRMDDSVITAPRGLLWMLDAIINQSSTQSPVELFEEAMTGSGPVRLESYVTVLGIAIRMYTPHMDDAQSERMETMRRVVKQSLHEGEVTYARITLYDSALSIMFPWLQAPLASNKGTYETARRVRIERMAQKQEQAAKLEAAQRQAQALQEEQDALQAALDRIALNYGWMPKAGWPNDLPTTEQKVRQSLSRHDPVLSLKWQDVLGSAWEAREADLTLAQWMQLQGVRTVADVGVRLRLLELAWMLHIRRPVGAAGR